MPRSLCLFNPAAGRGRAAARLPEVRALASARGVPLELSESAADLTARARNAAAEGVETLVVAGGDGTLHHVIQGLAGSDCALAILPLGSGNDLAAVLGVPRDPRQALERALEGARRRIDLGRVGERVFAGVAGVGFDSQVAEYAARLRRLRGAPLYAWSVIRNLLAFDPPRFRIAHDGGQFEGHAWLAALANSSQYGAGMRIAPGARLDSGRLELVIVKKVPAWELLRIFPRIYGGRHLGHPALEIYGTRAATLRLDRELTLYGDGEPLAAAGRRAVRVECWRGALAVAGCATGGP